MSSETSNLTPTEAARVLQDLHGSRHTLNHRAAGMSLMMWALVLTSAAGSLLVLNVANMGRDFSTVGWGLFMLAHLALLVLWLALGMLFQTTIWSSFHAPATGRLGWRAPTAAVTVLAALLWFNGVMQDITRGLQGIDKATAPYADLHHNLGIAMSLGIAGAFVIAITVLLAFRGFRWGPGVATGAGMILAGHLTTFLWVPDMGVAGFVVAGASVPTLLLGLGYHTWRRG